ncbi:MAG: hypothetical protein FWB78_08680 [Treponema sp.]|nr:hypothetical protein [Treponema sp.]
MNESCTLYENGEKETVNAKRWFRRVLTSGELKQFIKDARSGKNPGNALVGMVSNSTKEKVRELTGVDVSKIVLEEVAVAHIDAPKHNLEPDDIKNRVEVINNPARVTLSPQKTSQGLSVVLFEGDIGGEIVFVETVHKKYDGWLSVKTAYRKKKKAPSVPH